MWRRRCPGACLSSARWTTGPRWASLLLGAGAARVLSGPLPNLLGGLVLAGIGAWFVLDWLRRLGPAGEAEGENPGQSGQRSGTAGKTCGSAGNRDSGNKVSRGKIPRGMFLPAFIMQVTCSALICNIFAILYIF